MKLNYKILWVEDEVNYIDALELHIKRLLEDKGYILDYEAVTGWDEIDFCNINQFDLLLIDYKLDDSHDGDEVIEKIRSMDCSTAIVFYSGSSTSVLREKIAQRSLDGVYCATRPINDFFSVVSRIISMTLKKVEDVNNLRGLMLAHTSDIETSIRELIKSHFDKSDTQHQKNIILKTIKYCRESMTSNSRYLDRLAENYFEYHAFLDKCYFFDMEKKKNLLCHIINNTPELKSSLASQEEILQSFKDEIINVRNTLAHNDLNGEEPNPLKDLVGNPPDFSLIRKNIKKHVENLKRIGEKI